MFDRPAFKAAGKASFKRNYWLCVAVSIILAIALGSGAGGGATYNFGNAFQNGYDRGYYDYSYDNGFGSAFDGDFDPEFDGNMPFTGDSSFPVWPFMAAIGVVFTIVLACGLAVKICAANPFQVGANRFFMENRYANAQFSAVGAGFSKNYGNVVLTQFLKDLYIFLWTLLFIIPGIVKAYAYFCVPYILAENPGIEHDRAITLSREMTYGYKGDVFVTDLSFILWAILNGLTLGILGIFFLNPYIQSTHAEVYAFLRQNALEKGIATTVELPGFGEAPAISDGRWYN